MISVIVPVYQVELYLEKCIESILKQSYKDLELILVDDGSSDRSGVICDEYALRDPRVKVIHQENQGVSAARNTGLAYARGEWISFVDSDDYVCENLLEDLYEAAYSNNVVLSMCGITLEDVNGNIVCGYEESPIQNEVLESKEMLYRIYDYKGWLYILPCGKLYHRELLSSCSFSVGKLHEDEVFVVPVIWDAGKIACINKKHYTYLVKREGSITSKKTEELFPYAIEALTGRFYFYKTIGLMELAAMTRRVIFQRIEKFYLYCRECNDFWDLLIVAKSEYASLKGRGIKESIRWYVFNMWPCLYVFLFMKPMK